jgi:monofunctional chorismate mutase
MKTIDELRSEIDEIDDGLVSLFLQRLAVVKEVGEAKKTLSLSVEDKDRENAVIERLAINKTDEEKKKITELYNKIFDISKETEK